MIPYTIAVSVQGMADNLNIRVNGVQIERITRIDVPNIIPIDTACSIIAASILGQYVTYCQLSQLYPAFKEIVMQKIGYQNTHAKSYNAEFKIKFQGFLHRQDCLFKPKDPIEDGDATISYRHANPVRGTAIFLDKVGSSFKLTLCKGIDSNDLDIQLTIDPYWEAIQVEGEDPIMRKLYETLHKLYTK